MNQEIKAKWVAALRSGEYAQSTGSLRGPEGFCCLGVLCEISKQETGFGIPENLKENCYDENIGVTVRKWAGLSKDYGDTVCINGVMDMLTEHNDNGKTFDQIADAIEAQL